MNKTRGTCGECKTFDECAIRYQALSSMVLPSDRPSCADFERNDSIEQVALDMLTALKDTSKLCGTFGGHVMSMERIYADRLRALGVEVEE